MSTQQNKKHSIYQTITLIAGASIGGLTCGYYNADIFITVCVGMITGGISVFLLNLILRKKKQQHTIPAN